MPPLHRRLAPLYISGFLQSMVLWYAVEKLFMTSIGFTTATIGLMVAIMSAVILSVETPSGILADRWSRKGVMLLGCGALIASAVVGALSYNVPVFILSTCLWGVYNALYTGTYESALYDTILEENGTSDKYDYYLGRLRVVEGAGFCIAALVGAFLASTFSIRLTFWISIPLLLVATVILLSFKEPKLHKADVREAMLLHVRQTFAAVLKNKILIPVLVATVAIAVLLEAVYELNQVWFIALDTPLALYGIVGAIVFSTWSIGGFLAPKLTGKRLYLAAVTLLLGVASLALSRNYWLTLAGMFILGCSLIAFTVILSKRLHDALPSKLRAGSSSAVNTIAKVIVIPGSLLLTSVAQASSIFDAAYGLLAIAIIALTALMFANQPNLRTANTKVIS